MAPGGGAGLSGARAGAWGGADLARALARLQRLTDLDVIILGRGGGTSEDLAAFNEEILARAIFHSKVPIISAVGHEIDVTIADMVADRRALTPSEAAELATPDRHELLRHSRARVSICGSSCAASWNRPAKRLRDLSGHRILRRPGDWIRTQELRLDDLAERLRTGRAATAERMPGELCKAWPPICNRSAP